MKINTEIYGFIEQDALKELIDKNPELKIFIENQMDRMADEGIIRRCHGCSGGCPNCSARSPETDAAYLTTGIMSLFEYYIPEDIKTALHLVGSSYIGD